MGHAEILDKMNLFSRSFHEFPRSIVIVATLSLFSGTVLIG